MFLCLLLLVLILRATGISTAAQAQENNLVYLSLPNTIGFPSIQAFLGVRDQEGDFVYGLTSRDMEVLENEKKIPVSELEHLQPGAQIVLVINPGPSFAIRDSNGFSRYDYIVQHFQDWAESRVGRNIDDFSLLGTDGIEITHLESVEEWLSSLLAFQPDARNAVPDYDVLSRGLDIAADPTPRFGMGRSVIFITSLPPDASSFGLQNIVSRANQANVQIDVWLVASPERFSSQGAGVLRDLATQTGGDFFGFSGLETLPDIEDFLENLRNIYTLKYRSMISRSGSHRVSVHIQDENFAANSNEQTFELEILPPNIAFVSPNQNVSRVFLFDDSPDPDELIPKSQSLEVLVEFPDGFERSIEQTILYIDGQIAHRNTSPPFELFSWDLSGYTSSGEHTFRAEVMDELGLNNSTIDLKAEITVESPSVNFVGRISRNRVFIAVVSTATVSLILLLFLVLGGRLHPGTISFLRSKSKMKKSVPNTLKTNARPISRKLPYWVNRLHWPQRHESSNTAAYLVPLTTAEDAATSGSTPIPAGEVSIGRDATLAAIRLNDLSVDPLHAWLCYRGDETFLLKDNNSIAGTWINYAQVSGGGKTVEHGDLIHIGRVGFRFKYHNPKKVPQLVILEENWRR